LKEEVLIFVPYRDINELLSCPFILYTKTGPNGYTELHISN